TKDWQKKSGSELIRVGLNHQAHKKVLKYRDHVPVTFVPIVFGAGGAMSTLTTEHFKQWRRITPNWDHLQRLISVALVRKRVTNFRNDLLIVFCNLKPNQPIHNHNLTSDNKRMDLVLKESNGAGALTMHDITVHSSIALVPHIQQVTKDWQKKSGSELIRVGLNHQAHKKVLKYRNHVPVTFVPIVFGAGGAMSTLTTEHFKQWRRITPNWDHLQRLISFALVRKRVTNFRLI
ncbi:hypothetical protein E3Q13_04498, partial [Wallemia mellicola]